MSADRMAVKAKIKTWPIERLAELERRLIVWCYYVGRLTKREQWIIKTTQGVLNIKITSTARDAMIYWCDSEQLTKPMEAALGYFLEEGDESYVNLDKEVPQAILDNAEEWAANAYKRRLDGML